MHYLLGIDAGTSAMKAILFDPQGREIAGQSREYRLITGQGGMVECNPETYWSALKEVVRGVLHEVDSDFRAVKALAISSQAETFILLDKQHTPLRNAIVWLDHRAGVQAGNIQEAFGNDDIYHITGCPEVNSTWAATKLLWLRQNEPRIFQQIYKVLLIEDYLVYRLAGTFAVNGALCCSTLLYDINTNDWWPDMLDFIGLSPHQLPPLIPSGTAIAAMKPEIADELGFLGRPMVVSGGMDQACSCIGSGNIKAGVVTENTGTSLNVAVTTDVPRFDPQRRVPCQTHAISNKYIFLPWSSSGGILLRWFRDNFSEEYLSRATREKQDPYQLLIERAADIPPGSDGLVILPHLAGAMSPEMDPHARGVIYGINLATRREHMVKAIMESIAYLSRANIELAETMDIDITQIILVGGTSYSPIWNQIKADVLGKKVQTIKTREAGCLGAAILAGLAVGVYDSLEKTCAELIKEDRTFTPDAKHHAAYNKFYAIYQKLYETLKPLFELTDPP